VISSGANVTAYRYDATSKTANIIAQLNSQGDGVSAIGVGDVNADGKAELVWGSDYYSSGRDFPGSGLLDARCVGAVERTHAGAGLNRTSAPPPIYPCCSRAASGVRREGVRGIGDAEPASRHRHSPILDVMRNDRFVICRRGRRGCTL